VNTLLTDLFTINQQAQSVSENYEALINDYRGELASSVAKKNPALASTRRTFVAMAAKNASSRLTEFERDLTIATNAVMRLALKDSLSSDELIAFNEQYDTTLAVYLKDCVRSTLMSVRGLSSRDIKFGNDQLKSIGFMIMLNADNAGIVNAIKGAVVSSVVGGGNYTGKNGKEWRSITAVRAITRQHLLTVFNEVTLFAGKMLGDSGFIIDTVSRSNPYNNKVISLIEYDAIRASVFHPNANALIYRKISNQ